MDKQKKIVILGVSGRMGQRLVQAVEENPNTKLVGATERPGHDWVGSDLGLVMFGKKNGILVSDEPIKNFIDTDAVIDFTSPAATISHSVLSAQARIYM